MYLGLALWVVVLRYNFLFQRGDDNPRDGGFESSSWYKLVKSTQIYYNICHLYNPLPT